MGSLVRAQEGEQKVTKQLVTFFIFKDFFMDAVVYVLYSIKLDKFYIGQTIDLNNRLLQHNDPISSYSTKAGQPWEIFLTLVTFLFYGRIVLFIF
jgi:hypothetical protein